VEEGGVVDVVNWALVRERLRATGRSVLARVAGVQSVFRRIAVVVVVLSLVWAGVAWAANSGTVYEDPGPETSLVVLGVVAGAALLGWRMPRFRRALLLLVVLVTVCCVGGAILSWPAVAALVYLAVAEDPRRVPWPGFTAGAAGVMASLVVVPEFGPVAAVLAVLVGGVLGLLVRALDRSAALSREAASLRVEAAASAAHVQWLEQRSALARELHDVVGHHVTALVVTAEAGQVGSDSAALRAIADRGRVALGELDVLVRQLRDPGAPLAVTAPPRLGDIDELLAEPLRRSGVDVDVRVGEGCDAVDEVTVLTAYRIVQEALTNVTRHAGARTVWVEVDLGESYLRLRVSDDGIGIAATAPRGSGLVGMSERVGALQGILSVTPRPGGGTVVDAFLPRTLASARTPS
jgi:signal transduction histidine kinase